MNTKSKNLSAAARKALCCMLMTVGFVTQATATPTVVAQFISAASDSSTYKESVQGCQTVSVNVTQSGANTIANLYDDGSFALGYDSNTDGDLDSQNGDVVIVTGVWSNVDEAATKFRFQPDGNLKLDNYGWHALTSWMGEIACLQDTSNSYVSTNLATVRVLKSDMSLNTTSNAGTLDLSIEGYGQTTASLANPPKTLPKIKYTMQVKGIWQ